MNILNRMVLKAACLLVFANLACVAVDDSAAPTSGDSEGDSGNSDLGDTEDPDSEDPDSESPSDSDQEEVLDGNELGSLPSCGSDQQLFSVSPVADSDLKGLVPLGNLNPSSHTFPTDHLYFYLTHAGTSVYAPGDATLMAVTTKDYSLDDDPAFSDYTLLFYPCRDFQVKFGHLVTLSGELEAAIASAGSGSCTMTTEGAYDVRLCEHTLSLALHAGATLGTAGLATSSLFALDVGTIDGRAPALAYANPDRYFEAAYHLDALHAVCPVDYFEEEVKDQLSAKFGDYRGLTPRTVAPLCGEIEQDIPGTAQGKWYAEGTSKEQSSQDGPHLALVHDNVDPAKPVFSVGTSLTNLAPGAYTFTAAGNGMVNREFEAVASDGNTYCYESFRSLFDESVPIPMSLLVQMPTETTLKIERRGPDTCGPGPWAFTGNAADFER